MGPEKPAPTLTACYPLGSYFSSESFSFDPLLRLCSLAQVAVLSSFPWYPLVMMLSCKPSFASCCGIESSGSFVLIVKVGRRRLSGILGGVVKVGRRRLSGILGGSMCCYQLRGNKKHGLLTRRGGGFLREVRRRQR